MNLIPTELNQRLASAVRYSVSADRFYISGKAAFWWLVGLGLVTFGIGVAAGFGFYGYSYVTRNTDAAKTFASTFSKALAEVQLRAIAEGTVKLEPNDCSAVLVYRHRHDALSDPGLTAIFAEEQRENGLLPFCYPTR